MYLWFQHWEGRQEEPADHWPANLAELMSFRFSERPSLKKEGAKQLKKTPQIDP